MAEVVPPTELYSKSLRRWPEISIGGILWVHRCPGLGSENPFTLTKQFHPFEQRSRYRNATVGTFRLCGPCFPLIDAALNTKSVSIEIGPLDSDGFSDSSACRAKNHPKRSVPRPQSCSDPSPLFSSA